ncbi:MAG: hypothetical protein M1837_007069 [Sclerophora amabilis]|nr:MAG: hypothetical protein M1837_007069 [Sclerophora amabilis]
MAAMSFLSSKSIQKTVALTGIALTVICVLSWSQLNPNAGYFLYTSKGRHAVDEGSSRTSLAVQDNLYDVQNETLGFQNVFVLSLKERLDKRDAFSLSASLTGFRFDFIDGVVGSEMPDKSLPVGWDRPKMSDKLLGCYRAHMNFAQTIVKNRLSTAMVFEDDSDWDVHFKSQLLEYARGTRYILNASTADTAANSKFKDAYASSDNEDSEPKDAYASADKEDSEDTDVKSTSVSADFNPPHSPYGDDWDMLWLGHCSASVNSADPRKYVIPHDKTVAPPKNRVNFGAIPDMSAWPNNTRIVFEAEAGVCLYGYALSLRGAQKFLYYLSLHPFNTAVDLGIREMCQDRSRDFRCVAVFPQLVDSHKAAGPQSRDSDIGKPPDENREKGFTYNIKYSTRLNWNKLMNGQSDYDAQFDDIVEA